MNSKRCVNCYALMPSRAKTGARGPDIAWMVHCMACAALVADQMELIAARPDGAFIDIYRCRSCGTQRACRPGWQTRCMICLDDRTRLPDNAADVATKVLDALQHPPDISTVLRQDRNGDLREVWQQCARQTVEDQTASLSRPGWTAVATDVWGLPWQIGTPREPTSHGTWARHDVCGTVQKVTRARPECRKCPPEEGSRTHRAKAAQPQHLYLVHLGKVRKFGHGDANRVNAHLRAGADPVRVLRAPFEQVVTAELAIKRAYADQIINAAQRGMPPSFGAGTEVLPATTDLDIRTYLTGTQVEDVTHRFKPTVTRARQPRRWQNPFRRQRP
jgi:hypothetical protein